MMMIIGKLETSKVPEVQAGAITRKLGCGVWLENHRVFAERAENSLYWIDQRR